MPRTDLIKAWLRIVDVITCSFYYDRRKDRIYICRTNSWKALYDKKRVFGPDVHISRTWQPSVIFLKCALRCSTKLREFIFFYASNGKIYGHDVLYLVVVSYWSLKHLIVQHEKLNVLLIIMHTYRANGISSYCVDNMTLTTVLFS